MGSIGQRHARLLRDENHEVFAFRSDRQRSGNDLNLPEIFSWGEVETLRPEVAFITNPTFLHLETALPCAEREMALFIEKPVDCRTEVLESLLRTVEKKRLTSYVAYVLRFHPVVKILHECLKEARIRKALFQCSSFLPAWRKGRDHLETYSAKKKEGGGALLDLSHEFDMARFLLGEIKSIRGTVKRVSDVTLDADDCVDADLLCEKGNAFIHLDLFSRNENRSIHVETDEGRYDADLLGGRISFRSSQDFWEKSCPFDRDDLYRDQIHYFFQNIGNPKMMNNLPEASDLFKQLIAFRQAVE